jgi:hypothetical protein
MKTEKTHCWHQTCRPSQTEHSCPYCNYPDHIIVYTDGSLWNESVGLYFYDAHNAFQISPSTLFYLHFWVICTSCGSSHHRKYTSWHVWYALRFTECCPFNSELQLILPPGPCGENTLQPLYFTGYTFTPYWPHNPSILISLNNLAISSQIGTQ